MSGSHSSFVAQLSSEPQNDVDFWEWCPQHGASARNVLWQKVNDVNIAEPDDGSNTHDTTEYQVLHNNEDQLQKAFMEMLKSLIEKLATITFIASDTSRQPYLPRSTRPNALKRTLNYMKPDITFRSPPERTTVGPLDAMCLGELNIHNKSQTDTPKAGNFSDGKLGQLFEYLTALLDFQRSREAMYGFVASDLFICFVKATRTLNGIQFASTKPAPFRASPLGVSEGVLQLAAFLHASLVSHDYYPINHEFEGLQLIRELGSGASSHVFEVQPDSNPSDEQSQSRVLKIVKDEADAENEEMILKLFDSDFVVPHVLERRKKALLLTPCGLPLADCRGLPIQCFLVVLETIRRAAEINIHHRDVRPSNMIVVNNGHTKSIILIDWGYAINTPSAPDAGSTRYASQRVLQKRVSQESTFDYGLADDVCSLLKTIFVYYCPAAEPSDDLRQPDTIFDHWEKKMMGRTFWKNLYELAAKDSHSNEIEQRLRDVFI